MPKGKRLDIKPGDIFGQLKIIKELPAHNKCRYFQCECSCGNTKRIRLDSLTSGATLSCGCFNRKVSVEANTKHGMYKNRIYKIWTGMKQRCLSPSNTSYKNYGGRGIRVDQTWMNFETFKEWAMANGYKNDLTIERIDNNGNYEPSNCTWITMEEQKRNTTKSKRITYKGQTKTLRQWAKSAGIHSSTLCLRIKNGWDLGMALTAPPNAYTRRAAWK